MIYNGKLGSWECISLIGCISVIPLVLTAPTFIVENLGTGSFLYSVYITLLTGLSFIVLFKLYSKFKDQDIIDLSKFVGGSFLKYLTGLFIIFYLLISSIVTLSEFTENIRYILFDQAPPAYITTLFAITIFFGVLIGLRGIIRASALVAPIVILGFIALFISMISNIDLTNFTPIFGSGLDKIIYNGTTGFGRYESFILFFLLSPNIKNLGKTVTRSFLLISGFTLITVFILIGIFPFPSITEYYFPLFEVSRLIGYGRFIQRVDSIFILIWLLATFIYLSSAVAVAVHVIKKIFNIEYFKRIIPSVTISIISASLLFSSYFQIYQYKKIILQYVTPVFLILYPLIILIIAHLKVKRKEKVSRIANQ